MNKLGKLWTKLLAKISPLFPAYPGLPDQRNLAEEVQASLREWKLAKEQFNHVGPELVDYMVFRLNAAERHYMVLLSQAKAQGVKAWPGNLAEPVKNSPISSNPSGGLGQSAPGTCKPPA